MKHALRLCAATVAVAAVVLSVAVGLAQTVPWVQTDNWNYVPGETAIITGGGFAANETVWLRVQHVDGTSEPGAGHEPWPVQASDIGEFNSTWAVNPDDSLGATFLLTADGETSGRHAEHTFIDANPAADLDQCANDPSPSPSSDGCATAANQWVNGNLGASKSLYLEGDSIPYRIKLANLNTAALHTVVIEWDTTKAGTHAIDYLTSFNRSVLDANPCLGISGCNAGTLSTFPIPADPQVTGAGVTPVAGNFSLYGGTITSVSTYSYPDGTGFAGDKSARITITFSASVANPVLAWGGHIATRQDWGIDASAVAIPGSPYHTRLISLNGSGGNQDRSLSADAVIYPARLTIIKDAVPDGPTDFTFTAISGEVTGFSLDDDGDPTLPNSRAFNLTTFGTAHQVTEADPAPAFQLTNLVCVESSGGLPNTSNSTTSLSTRTASIIAEEAEIITCTFTNTQQQAHLIIIKHVINDNGGTATAASFTMTASGPTPYSGPGAESPGSNTPVDPGTYTIGESGPAGYTATYSGDCDPATHELTLAAGQTKTCTITNDDDPARLTLVKLVVNDNGGTAQVSDWTLSATGPTSITGTSGTAAVTSAPVNAGAYTLSEAGPTGYTASAWSCTGGTQNGSGITLALGQSATCTITNDDQSAHLRLVKTVINNNGGTAVATDFTLSAAGPTPISGAGGADADVSAGVYALSETTLLGYTASAWSCVGGVQNASSITLALGQSATCTITNDDQAAHLKLVKTVVNNNGGTAVATDFTLSAAGPTPISGAGGVESDVNAGAYTLSETTLPGYTAGTWSCVGGTQNSNSIALAVGQSATCTITNDDDTARLTLVKVVVNNNGGIAEASDWMLSASGPTSITGQGGTAAVTNAPVNAGSYTLGEEGPAGYTASAWSCVGGTQNVNSIALAVGESATCTITNDDQAAHLKLVKTVLNNDGGTAVATDFTLTATGPTPLSGAGGAEGDVDAGAYALSENNLSGYAAGTWACVGGTQTGSSIALALGQSATCTITNDDLPAFLRLIKVVNNDNGGTAVPTDFIVTASGPTPLTGYGTVSNYVDAGQYQLSETNLAGYTAGTWSCTGGSLVGSTLTLRGAQSATCTITNDDQPATLKVTKVVVNDNGGGATTGSFGFQVNGGGVQPFGGTGLTTTVTLTVNAGNYNVTEPAVAGYTTSYTNCSLTIPNGGTGTCTITNNDQPGTLQIVKRVVNDNGGTAGVSAFGIATSAGALTFDSGTVAGAVTTYTSVPLLVNAGTWTLRESDTYGYTEGTWSCTGATPNDTSINNGSVNIGIGVGVVCTITNDDQPGRIVIIKNAKPANGSFSFTVDGSGYQSFVLTGDPTANGNRNEQTLNPGTYTVQEATQLGWILTGIGGSTNPNTPYACTVTGSGGSTGVGSLSTQTATIDLKNGDTVTCAFENTGNGATRTQGFWATHPQLAEIAWFGGSAFNHTFPGVAATSGILNTTLCTPLAKDINTLGRLAGGFWSDVSKKSTGAKRTNLDQSRMQLLQQLLAAELNASAFGSVPAGGAGMFATWEAAYCGNSQQAIQQAMQGAASFNTAGDSATFTPGTSADSRTARSIAAYSYWDTLP